MSRRPYYKRQSPHMFLISSFEDCRPCQSQDRRGPLGLSAPGGLVDKDRSRVALCVCFMVDGDTDGFAGGGGEGEEEGGGEPGGVAMVL